METRVDKYRDKKQESSRVEKNQDLYKMIYSAYDEFENYKVPMEEKEIDLSNVKKSVTSRQEYMKAKQYGEFTNRRVSRHVDDLDKKSDDVEHVYDIKELLNRVKTDDEDDGKTTISEEKYLDKLHLKENVKTNLELMKEKYEDVVLDSEEVDKLSNTANLSLEILSDLKSNEDTMVSPPMKDEDEDDEIEIKTQKVEAKDTDDSFYSDMYKFKKKDFETDNDEELDDDEFEDGDGGFLFKILIIISIVILFTLIAIYLIGYFSK